MAIDSNVFYKHQESRAQSGYKAAILYRPSGATKYQLLVASTTVPSVFGTTDSFEFDLLNSPTKGKVKGKMTLDDKEVEVLHHRDNVLLFERLKDQVIDFMVVDSQFVGYKFTGTLSYRMNDATADVLMGTYTITPMSADTTPVLDARSEIRGTLVFANAIPETVAESDVISYSTIPAVEENFHHCNIYRIDENNNRVLIASTALGSPTVASNAINKEKQTITFSNLFVEGAGMDMDYGSLVEIVVEVANLPYADATTTVFVEPPISQ